MKLKQMIVLGVMIIAALFLVVFLLDLTLLIPFQRFNIWTDIFVIISASLILWQGIETWIELRAKRK